MPFENFKSLEIRPCVSKVPVDLLQLQFLKRLVYITCIAWYIEERSHV